MSSVSTSLHSSPNSAGSGRTPSQDETYQSSSNSIAENQRARQDFAFEVPPYRSLHDNPECNFYRKWRKEYDNEERYLEMTIRYNKFDHSETQTSTAELTAVSRSGRSTPGQQTPAQKIPINSMEKALQQHEHVETASRMIRVARSKQPSLFASTRSPNASGELSESNTSVRSAVVSNLSPDAVESQLQLMSPQRQQHSATSENYSSNSQKNDDSPYKIFCPCGVALTRAEEERFKCLNSIAARQHEEQEASRQMRLAALPDRRGRRLTVPPKRELRLPRLYRIALDDLRRDTAVPVLVPPTLVELPVGTYLPERAAQRFAPVLRQTDTPPTESEPALRTRAAAARPNPRQ